MNKVEDQVSPNVKSLKINIKSLFSIVLGCNKLSMGQNRKPRRKSTHIHAFNSADMQNILRAHAQSFQQIVLGLCIQALLFPKTSVEL